MDTDILRELPTRIQAQISIRESGCWEWTGPTLKGGYGRPSIRGRHTLLHRTLWEMANGPIPAGEGYHGTCVLHICDNPCCCNPVHLRLGTNQDNMDDRNSKGRQAKGRAISTVKLHEREVIEIRRRYSAGGVTMKSLAGEFGVAETTIGQICRRVRWKHLPEDDDV